MKRQHWPPLLMFLGAAAAVSLAGCASTAQSRIARRPELYNRLPASQQSLVSQGRIIEGMGKDAVYLAWGTPDSVKTSSEESRLTETWIYTGMVPEYVGYHYAPIGRFPRYGYHGYDPFCHGYSPSVYYRRYVAGMVTYRNDVVTQWEVSHR
jgi:hypothetical protein